MSLRAASWEGPPVQAELNRTSAHGCGHSCAPPERLPTVGGVELGLGLRFLPDRFVRLVRR